MNIKKGDISILVCSCDKYEDLWNPMFEMFIKFWEDCQLNIYLMTNNKKYNHEKVISIKTGDDVSWSRAFRKALNNIQSEYVFIIMEDYLLKNKVNIDEFLGLVEYMRKENAVCIRTMPSLYANEQLYGKYGDYRVGLVSKDDPYRISLQAGIWKKEYIMSIIDDKDSAWEFEHLGSKRSARDNSKILCTLDKDKIIFDYYCTGVIQGYWIQEAVDLCKEHGVTVDLEKRSIESKKVRMKRLFSERYFLRTKNFLKKTFIYDIYREKKFG